jgi:hypothetical protein
MQFSTVLLLEPPGTDACTLRILEMVESLFAIAHSVITSPNKVHTTMLTCSIPGDSTAGPRARFQQGQV